MSKNQKGSVTVETAILMPFVLTVILIMLFLVIHMYNRGVMTTAVARGIKQVFYCEYESNSKIEQECMSVALMDLEDSLIAVDEPEIKIEVSWNRVRMTMSGKLNVPPLLAPEGTIFEEFWKYEICEEVVRLNPAELIQGGQQIENIAGEVKQDGD